MIGILDRVAAILAASIVAMTAIVTCMAVFFRSAIGASLPWPEELSGHALVWTSFLGAYLATRDHRHISFDLLVERLPHASRRVLRMITDGFVIGFFVLLIYESIRMISVVGHRELQTISLPVGLFMAALPVCGAAIVLALCVRIIERWGNIG